MRRTHAPRLTLARLVRYAEARRVAAVALSLAAAGPALGQAPGPQGGEFRVNTVVEGEQESPSVAMDADGDYVVVWRSHNQDRLDGEIYAQRYAASGTPIGGEFQVNTYTTGNQRVPAVAMDADGDFVVAWESVNPSGPPGQDGSGSGVFAQRYTASGAPAGPEFRVNTYTESYQMDPSVAVDDDGAFVVAWSSIQDGWYSGIYAQRYAANGSPVSGEFQVNTYTQDYQTGPSVAVDDGGAFVVVWSSYGQDGVNDSGIYAQRYAVDGSPAGGEFRVNTYTPSHQTDPSATVDADGNLVVAWMSYGQAGGSGGVYAQRYAPDGSPAGGEFRVNTLSAGDYSAPSVAADAGGIVVAWHSRDGNGNAAVRARRYAASGTPVGGEFRVNTRTVTYWPEPSVAASDDGAFVVAWTTRNENGLDADVYAQRYTTGPVASEPAAAGDLALALVPSPVGPSGGRVRYETPEAGRVRLTVSDVLGRQVAVLVDGVQGAGPHSAALDAGRLAPGVYVVRLEAGGSTVVRRVTVAR